MRPTLAPLLLSACMGRLAFDDDLPGDRDPVDDPHDPTDVDRDTDSDETDTPPDTEVVDTDTDAPDGEVDTDTDVLDSDSDIVVDSDTDEPDTVVVDTDVLDTVVVDTDRPDTVVVDTDRPDTVVVDTFEPTPGDADGDGFPAADDCDDHDADVHPEVCNGVDDGCVPGWTPSTENAHVSWQDADGRWTDVTSAFPRTSPARTFTVPASGTLRLCQGIYHARIEVPDGVDVALVGVRGASLTKLDADATGDVVHVERAHRLAVTGLTLTDGNGTCPPFPWPPGSCRGGGITSSATSVLVSDSVLARNVGVAGGGILVNLGTAQDVRLERVALRSNTAGHDGGGAWIALGGRARLEIDGLDVTGNVAQGIEGGGLKVHLQEEASLDVRGAVFEDNRAGGGPPPTFFDPAAYGGGMSVWSASSGAISIVDSAFRRNVAVGLLVTSSPTLGHYGNGGGLALRVYGRPAPGGVVLRGLELVDNLAGVHPTQGGNGRGGGLYLLAPEDVLLEDSTIARNHVGHLDPATAPYPYGDGGGVHYETYAGAPGTLRVARTTIADNTTLTTGGGLFVTHGHVELDGVQVLSNATAGGLGMELALAHYWSYGEHASVALVGGTVVGGSVAPASAAPGTSAITLVDGTSLTCTGSTSDRTGVLGSTTGVDGAAVWLQGAATFTGTSCDLGVPGTADDNVDAAGASADVAAPGLAAAALGDDATFTCDVAGCR